jgi:hypothetical protein
MGFKVPQMPLRVNVWTAFGPPFTPLPVPRLTCRGQLRVVKQALGTEAGSNNPAGILLLVPAGTDLRPLRGFALGSRDQCEVPAGSGRFYDIDAIEDVAKGFPNEYRVALLAQNTYTGAPPLP